ncbi:sorting nexin [Thoreauomyces humboldtii]|nr:sorting nexin [Thoreauomyces humboldtii]
MVKARVLSPKSIFDEELVLEAFRAEGIKDSAARLLWRVLIQRPELLPADSLTPWRHIAEFPKAAAKVLDEQFVLTTSRVVTQTDAKDMSTTKLLIELQDGQRIESVIMRYGQVELDSFPRELEKRKGRRSEGPPDPNEVKHDDPLAFRSKSRATLCVSSQVGCAMGCTFCATGTMGLLSNLTSGEIIEQIYHANKVEKIRNVVFMGMGEPLDNYDAVIMSIKAMADTSRFSLSPSRISVSTVGVVPRIQALKRDAPAVGLALSLHAPTQALRSEIVPTSKAWHVDRILAACDAFIENQNKDIKSKSRRRHIMVEYVLIKDINDSVETAHDLGKLLKGREVLLNVIPYNITSVPFDYETPSREASRIFAETVRSYDVHVLLRQTMGADSASACGQLVIDNGGQKAGCGDSEKNGAVTDPKAPKNVADLEDLMAGGGRSKVAATPTGKRRNARDAKAPLADDGTPAATSPGFAGDRMVRFIIAGSLALVLGRVLVKYVQARS